MNLLGDLAPEAFPAVVGGGVFTMLAVLFAAMLKAVQGASARTDARADAELARGLLELERTQTDRDEWRRLYLELLEELYPDQRARAQRKATPDG